MPTGVRHTRALQHTPRDKTAHYRAGDRHDCPRLIVHGSQLLPLKSVLTRLIDRVTGKSQLISASERALLRDVGIAIAVKFWFGDEAIATELVSRGRQLSAVEATQF